MRQFFLIVSASAVLLLRCSGGSSSGAAVVAAARTDFAPGKSVEPDSAVIAYLTGKFDFVQHPDFEPVSEAYADRSGMYLRKETVAAFKKMHEAARREGITLTVISATRNFYRQKAS